MRARSRFQEFRSRMSRTFPPNLARIMLLCCAALWGGSYLVAKVAMTAITPQWLMTMRMTGSCIIMFVLFHRVIIPALTREIIIPALVVGVTYYGTMIMQTEGLTTIDPGRSAFLTASYCVLTPFAAWIVVKQRPKLINLVAAIICLTGVGFVALKPGSGALALGVGDWMTIANAVIFSFNLTFLGRYTQRFHPIAVTFMQFAVADVFFLIGALFTEPLPNASWLASNADRGDHARANHAKHRLGPRAPIQRSHHHVYGKSVRRRLFSHILGRSHRLDFHRGLLADFRCRHHVRSHQTLVIRGQHGSRRDPETRVCRRRDVLRRRWNRLPTPRPASVSAEAETDAGECLNVGRRRVLP